jgi:hypothetical protein
MIQIKYDGHISIGKAYSQGTKRIKNLQIYSHVYYDKFTKSKHCYDSDHRKNCILQSYQSNMWKSIYTNKLIVYFQNTQNHSMHIRKPI